MAALCAQPLCFLLGYGGYVEAMEGPRGLHRQTHAKATMWRSATRRLTLLHKQRTWKVCSQKKTLLQRVLGPSSFWSFVFSKGTNAELNLRSTLQVVSKVVVPFLENQFHFIEIYKTECWSRVCRSIPIAHVSHQHNPRCVQPFCRNQQLGVHTHFVAAGDPNERSPPVWPKFMCEQLQLFTEIKYSASRKLGIYRLWKYQPQNSWVVPSTCLIVLHHP